MRNASTAILLSSCDAIVNTVHVAPTKLIKKFVAASLSACVVNGDVVVVVVAGVVVNASVESVAFIVEVDSTGVVVSCTESVDDPDVAELTC